MLNKFSSCFFYPFLFFLRNNYDLDFCIKKRWGKWNLNSSIFRNSGVKFKCSHYNLFPKIQFFTFKFEQMLGIKTILMGFGLESDAIHSPNENFALEQFFNGIRTIPLFYKYFAEIV